jgi:hypothetical protein
MAKKKQHGGKRKGAGRPVNPEGRAVMVAVSIPEGLMTELDKVAYRKNWGRSKAVTEAVRAYLKRTKDA